MLIRVLQAGHNTVVFSSGIMIRKLASANPALKRLSAKLSSLPLEIGAFAASPNRDVQRVTLGIGGCGPLRSRYRNDILRSAGIAPEDFIARHAGHGAQRRLRLVLNPTVGALVTVPQAWPKIEKTGSRQLRRFELRLCLDPALLYRHKLQLQSSHTALQAIGHVGSLIQQNLLNAHAARRRLVAARATHSRGGPLEPRADFG
jgi:hypothetical protein